MSRNEAGNPAERGIREAFGKAEERTKSGNRQGAVVIQ